MVEMDADAVPHHLVRFIQGAAEFDVLPVCFRPCDECQTVSDVLLVAGMDILFHTYIDGTRDAGVV